MIRKADLDGQLLSSSKSNTGAAVFRPKCGGPESMPSMSVFDVIIFIAHSFTGLKIFNRIIFINASVDDV